jgi:hypothetical protein
MKLIPSPLINQVTGKGGGAVAATWRGVNYARGYNPKPANPQSAAQQLTRASLAVLVKIWQHMDSWMQAAWEKAAEGLPKSGYNMLLEANVAAQIAAYSTVLTPSNPDEFPLSSLSLGATLATSQVINWVLGSATGTHKVEVQVFKRDHPTDPAAVTEAMGIPAFESHDTVLASALTATATGLVTATDYRAFVSVYDSVTGYLSKSLYIDFTTS